MPTIAGTRCVRAGGLFLLTMPLLFAACGGADGALSGAAPSAGPAVKDPVPVAVEAVSIGMASSYHTGTAVLEAESRAEVRSRTTGVVRRILHEEGDRVVAGAALLQLEDDSARVKLHQAELLLEKGKTEFARRESMRAAGVMAEEDYLTARNELRQREADLEIARLELGYTRVEAPFGGQVVRRLIDLGSHVSPGTPLYELMDVEPLLAKIHVPTSRSLELAVGQTLELELESSGAVLTGRVRLVSPIVDAASGTVKVTAEVVSYPAGTRPGDFARVRIVTARHGDAKLVPSRAVVEERGEHVVFVVRDGKAARLVVTPGFIDGDKTEILDGLEAGESVVIKGQRSLENGDAVKVTEGELSAIPGRVTGMGSAG